MKKIPLHASELRIGYSEPAGKGFNPVIASLVIVAVIAAVIIFFQSRNKNKQSEEQR